MNPWEQIEFIKRVLATYREYLTGLASRIDGAYPAAVQMICECSGAVITTGMGKAGLIAQKVAATLASTGTPSHFLHPAEAVHGDLGRVGRRDLVWAFSFSGKTEELVRLLPVFARWQTPLLATTGGRNNPLAQAARVVLELGPLEEACPLRLAPTTSTLAMLAVGDAVAMTVARCKGFQAADFATLHPAGSLGLKLSRVQQHMRPRDQCRVAPQDWTVRQVYVSFCRPGRRSGAIMLVDEQGRLSGLFTDSDLARLLERKQDQALDQPIRGVMTRSPVFVQVDTPMVEAVELLARRKISELPVVDPQGRPVGMIDITDVVGLFPELLQRSPSLPRARSA